MKSERNALIDFLNDSRQQFVALAKSLTPTELDLPTENDGWTAKDILAHVASSEAGLIATARRIIEGQTSPRPGFDLHGYNQHQVEKRRGQTVDELLNELAESRAKTLAMLEQLTDEQLAVEGKFSSGDPTNVMGVFRRIGDHEMFHSEQIRRAALRG